MGEKLKMKIKNFILINSIWVICLLLVGCPTPNPELVKQRDLLIKANAKDHRNDMLITFLNLISILLVINKMLNK